MVYSFQFAVQNDYPTTANAVRQAATICGSGAKERAGSEFVFRSSVPNALGSVKFTLYIAESNQISTIRIMCKTTSDKSYVLAAYDHFLIALEQSGLNIPVAPGKPYIVTTLPLGGGLSQQFTTTQQFSVGGAIVGGLIFGDLGAILGGYSGTQKTRSRTVLSKSAFFLLCYSNGMVEEKEVRKNSKLYAEVMAKLNADPVIHKDMAHSTYANGTSAATKAVCLIIAIPLLVFVLIRLFLLIAKYL